METWQSFKPNTACGTGMVSEQKPWQGLHSALLETSGPRLACVPFRQKGLLAWHWFPLSPSLLWWRMPPSVACYSSRKDGLFVCISSACPTLQMWADHKCVFALESFTPQGERAGEDCTCTVVPAPFVWFPYYAIMFNIIILFLFTFGWEEGRECMWGF